MMTQREKCERFQALHTQAEAFIIPNPLDAGSAKVLQSLGFSALATTSSGFAYTLARRDGQTSLGEKLAHCRSLAGATDIPVSADFEDGYADDPQGVAANVLELAATGVAGCSVEDYSRHTHTLFDFDHAVDRIAAAAAAVGALDMPFQLTARAENLIRGVNDLDDTIARLQAYRAAGADVLYAPGIRSLADLETVTRAVDGPVNVLAPFMPDASLEQFAAAGAQRISLGGALTWATVKPLLEASREMLERGTFGWLRQAASGAEVSGLLEG